MVRQHREEAEDVLYFPFQTCIPCVDFHSSELLVRVAAQPREVKGSRAGGFAFPSCIEQAGKISLRFEQGSCSMTSGVREKIRQIGRCHPLIHKMGALIQPQLAEEHSNLSSQTTACLTHVAPTALA